MFCGALLCFLEVLLVHWALLYSCAALLYFRAALPHSLAGVYIHDSPLL